MIRDATHDDIPAIIEMGRRFFEAAGYTEIGTFNEEVVRATVAQLIESETGIVLVSDDLKAMTGALVYPFYMTGELTAQEIVWWVEPSARGAGRALLTALEARVREKGAGSLVMIALESLEPERVGMIYRRAGYRPSEHNYIKVL